MTKKIDCIGEDCNQCGQRMSCLRIAILTPHGEYADYNDVCAECASAAAQAAGLTETDFSVRQTRAERMMGGPNARKDD